MDDRIFSGEQKAKLTQMINEGMQVMHEVETLNGGLSDTIKAVAEELEIKPSIINKAITIAHKDNWKAHEQEWNDIEMILGVTNRLPKDE